MDITCKISDICNKGQGLVAIQNIFSNTVIFREQPVITFTNFDDAVEKYKFLPSVTKKRIHKLSNEHPYLGDLLGIIKTNSLDILSNTLSCKSLCLMLSRINHSCSPNSEILWDHIKREHVLHSIKHIPSGTEICISYRIHLQQHNIRERLKEIRKTFGFRCACEHCKCLSILSSQKDMRIKYSKFNVLSHYYNMINIF